MALDVVTGAGHGRDVLLAALAGLVAARLVGQAARGDRHQPRLRMGRDPFDGPLEGRREQRLLDGVLAGVETAPAADQHRQHLRRQFAQQAVGHRVQTGHEPSNTGRISTAENSASGSSAASSTARSSEHSTM